MITNQQKRTDYLRVIKLLEYRLNYNLDIKFIYRYKISKLDSKEIEKIKVTGLSFKDCTWYIEVHSVYGFMCRIEKFNYHNLVFSDDKETCTLGLSLLLKFLKDELYNL